MVGWDSEKAEPALPQAYPPGYCRKILSTSIMAYDILNWKQH